MFWLFSRFRVSSCHCSTLTDWVFTHTWTSSVENSSTAASLKEGTSKPVWTRPRRTSSTTSHPSESLWQNKINGEIQIWFHLFFFFFTILNLLSGPVEAWLSSTGRNGALCGTETGALRESIRLYLWNISCRQTALSRCSRPRRKPRNSSRSKHSSWFLTYAQKYVMGCSSGQMRDSDCL